MMIIKIPHLLIFLCILFKSTYTTQAQDAAEGKIWESWEKVSELPFSMRDGVGVVHFKGEKWMIGGWKYGPLTNDIYKSSDAINWEKVGNAEWPGRHGAGMVVFKDKIWVISGDGHPDVWSSEDGVNWTEEVTRAPWGKRYAPYIAVFRDKIWLMGGISYWDENDNYSQYNEQAFNDVWSSIDGVNWKLETKAAAWGPRGTIHGSVIFNDEIWILGGGSKFWNRPTYIYNDVWKSRNGIDWELVTGSAGWNPRIHFSTIAFDNKLWAIDGTTATEALTNEVWYSKDGKDWNKLNSATSFPPTHASTLFEHNGSLYMAAGYDIDGIYRYIPPKKQLLEATKLPTVKYGQDKDTLNMGFRLTSGLQPEYFVLDTIVAEVLPFNRLLVKNAGETQIAVSHPGTYGYYPVDTVLFDVKVLKSEQNILVQNSVANEALISDTIRVGATASSGLPVKIVPNENIIVTADTAFVIKNSGQITVELVQEGNNNYYATSEKLELYVASPERITVYPNPAQNFIRVISEDHTTIDQFIITSLTGQVIKTFSGEIRTGSFYTLELQDLVSGVYVLSIISPNSRITYKFVKKG
jgi:hypothetical protein